MHAIDHGGVRLKLDTAKRALTADQVIVALPTTLIAAEALRFVPALPDR